MVNNNYIIEITRIMLNNPLMPAIAQPFIIIKNLNSYRISKWTVFDPVSTFLALITSVIGRNNPSLVLTSNLLVAGNKIFTNIVMVFLLKCSYQKGFK